MRLDVLPELDLSTSQESADVGLHVRRSDVEHIGAKRLRSFTSRLIGEDTEGDTGELLSRESGAGADEVVAAATRRTPRAEAATTTSGRMRDSSADHSAESAAAHRSQRDARIQAAFRR